MMTGISTNLCIEIYQYIKIVSSIILFFHSEETSVRWSKQFMASKQK